MASHGDPEMATADVVLCHRVILAGNGCGAFLKSFAKLLRLNDKRLKNEVGTIR